MKAILLAALAVLAASPVFGQITNDVSSYCIYVEEQAQSQKTLYRMPNLEAGVSQTAQTAPATAYAGANASLSNLRKSQLVAAAAQDNCKLYRATIDAQEHISYALPSIERDALTKRLALTTQAIGELNALILQNQKKVDARDATIAGLYVLQSAQAKLEADRASSELTLSSLTIPALSDEPLKNLAGAKQTLELEAQKDSAKLSKQDNWDVALTAGIRHNASPLFATPPGAYGGFDAKWNIGSWKRNRQLEQTADDYTEWKRQQDNDVIRNMALLRRQIENAIEAQERALQGLQANGDVVRANREKIKDIETDAAILFDNQLEVDELSLRIEIGTTEFRLARLNQYLVDNF